MVAALCFQMYRSAEIANSINEMSCIEQTFITVLVVRAFCADTTASAYIGRYSVGRAGVCDAELARAAALRERNGGRALAICMA